MSEPTQLMQFPAEFDDELEIAAEPGNKAFFGRTVLQGLIDGIDDFIQPRHPRWRPRVRSLGPVLLASTMGISDNELLGKISELSAACIVVPKDKISGKLDDLRALNERTPGMPIGAFSQLSDLAPKVGGQPQVVGPYSVMDDFRIPTIRTIGFRSPTGYAPILHAKLALLGHLWWHDEHPSGVTMDIIGFDARRLWVSSANFTSGSRRSLEFGFWTENTEMMKGAERFLVKLMRYSESLDPTADAFDPERAPVEFDDQAMAEAAAEMQWDENE